MRIAIRIGLAVMMLSLIGAENLLAGGLCGRLACRCRPHRRCAEKCCQPNRCCCPRHPAGGTYSPMPGYPGGYGQYGSGGFPQMQPVADPNFSYGEAGGPVTIPQSEYDGAFMSPHGAYSGEWTNISSTNNSYITWQSGGAGPLVPPYCDYSDWDEPDAPAPRPYSRKRFDRYPSAAAVWMSQYR